MVYDWALAHRPQALAATSAVVGVSLVTTGMVSF